MGPLSLSHANMVVLGFHHEEEQTVLDSGAFFAAYFSAEEVTKSIPGRLFSVMIY